MQEFEAAKSTVLRQFPAATILQDRRDSGPLQVRILAMVGDDETEVWAGDQRGLFKKNGQRDAPRIEAALAQFKKTLTVD